MPEKLQKIIKEMFEDKKLDDILEHLSHCSYFEDYDECFDENNCYNSKIVNELIKLIEHTFDEFGQKSYIFNGKNGLYPLIKAKYNMFEPEMEIFTVNMKEVLSNKAGNGDFSISLYQKEDESQPSLIALFAEPRNCPKSIFFCIVE